VRKARLVDPNLQTAQTCLRQGKQALLETAAKDQAIEQLQAGLAALDNVVIASDTGLRATRWQLLFFLGRAHASEPDREPDQAIHFRTEALNTLCAGRKKEHLSAQEQEQAAVILFHLGDDYSFKREYGRALIYYQEAADCRPGNKQVAAWIQQRLGSVFLELGKRKEAHRAFQAVAEVDPDFQFADARYVCYQLAHWEYDHKAYARALKYRLKALEVADAEPERFPQTYLIHQALGYVYFVMSLYEQAISHFRDSLRFAPLKAPERAAIVQHLRAAEKRLAEQESRS
jgi:tetratricopeptide (TPR) repeat protein